MDLMESSRELIVFRVLHSAALDIPEAKQASHAFVHWLGGILILNSSTVCPGLGNR